MACDDGQLAGGLYGVAIGGLFAGESMFHRGDGRLEGGARRPRRAAVRRRAADRLLDVQWQTPHLAALGAVEVPRADYLARVAAAVELPLPTALAG